MNGTGKRRRYGSSADGDTLIVPAQPPVQVLPVAPAASGDATGEPRAVLYARAVRAAQTQV